MSLNKFDFCFKNSKKQDLMGGKHYNKKNCEMFKVLEKDGFCCMPSGKNFNKFFVSRGKGEKYLVHPGDKAFHPLKRWLKKTYNYDFQI